jgi:hypothetical protein
MVIPSLGTPKSSQSVKGSGCITVGPISDLISKLPTFIQAVVLSSKRTHIVCGFTVFGKASGLAIGLAPEIASTSLV